MLKINPNIKLILVALFLVLAQTIFFDNNHIFSWVVPVIYTFFIYYFPINKRSSLLMAAFALGLFIDFAISSSGIHCFATTLIAYLREPLWRNFSLIKDERGYLNRTRVDYFPFFLSVFILQFIHYLTLYSVELLKDIFEWKSLIAILIRTIASFAIITLFYLIFSIKLIHGEK